MRVYFVRHGESEANLRAIHMGGVPELTAHGFRQADQVAERFQSIDVDVIVSSPFIRARQTAESIARLVDKEIIESDLFIEKKFPSEFLGKKEKSPEVLEIYKHIHKHRDDPKWHYSDEENFWDLQARALKAWQFIENCGKENILVVTHGVFLRFLVFAVLFGDKFTPALYYDGPGHLRTSNTGITFCEKIDEDLQWRFLAWNDHAHLG